MGDARQVGIILGLIFAGVGLVSAITSVLIYGLDSPLTIIFFVVFTIGLLAIGLVESE
jgi:hypothetical protein